MPCLYEEFFGDDGSNDDGNERNAEESDNQDIKGIDSPAKHLITPNNPIHMITLKHLRKYDNLQVIALWKRIKPILKTNGVNNLIMQTGRTIQPAKLIQM
jgi:hypothetical protein